MKSIKPAIFLLACSIIIACNSNSNAAKEQSYEDSIQSLLIGSWGNPNEDTPVWKIDKDSIYYLQNRKSYSYTQDSNDVIIDFHDHKATFKNVSFIKDTMFFYPDDGGSGIFMACRKR